MTEKVKIGKRISEIRKEKGISQVQLSNLTGIKQPNIARIEAGQHSIGIDVLAKISDALGCEVQINDKINDHDSK